jgi:NAD(P)H dehydrogenase (quinone)
MEQATPPAAIEDTCRLLIVYYSRFGAIRSLAEQIAEGARGVPGTTVELLEVEEEPLNALRPGETEEDRRGRQLAMLNTLAHAQAIITGSPAYFGSLASPLKRFFEDCATAESAVLDRSRPWHHYVFRDKVGAAFTSSATPHGGNEQALHSILTMLMHLGMIVATPGMRGPILEHQAAPYGATAITGPTGQRGPSEGEAEEARYLGRRVATLAAWLRAGRQLGAQREQEQLLTTGKPFDPSA